MLLRFSVCAGQGQGQGHAPAAQAWHVVDVPLIGDALVIGRDPGAAIALPFLQVSASHARVLRDQGGYHVEDLGSANGTWLGERRLPPHTPWALATGEVLHLADIAVRFDGELPDPGAASTCGTETLGRRLVHEVFSACVPAEAIALVGLLGPGAGRSLSLLSLDRPHTIGRGEACDLVLHDEDVSREHATLEHTGAGVLLRDLDSKNGVEVDGQRIAGARSLRDGARIRIGQTTFRFDDPEDRYLRQVQNADDAASRLESVAEARPPSPAQELVSSSSARSAGETGGPARPRVSVATAGARGRLPTAATTVAVLVLLWLLGLVLALAFSCQV